MRETALKGVKSIDNSRTKSIDTAALSPATLMSLFLAAGLVLAFLLSVGTGAVGISPGQVAAIVAHKAGLFVPIDFSAREESVLLAIRLPRTILGGVIGAGLAIAGAVLQGLFRNPLADPTLIGVSAGAALAVSLAIVLGETSALAFLAPGRVYLLPAASFCGSMCATMLIYRLGKRDGEANVATMLLAGIAISAFAMAGIGLMSFLATDAQLRNISFWTLGSLSGATWPAVVVTTPLILGATFILLRLSRSFNIILLGESEARHLGLNTVRLKWQAISLVALIIGTAVAVSGIISFVGLVVPHLLRLTFGADHRHLLRNAALLGAILMIGADILARTILSPAELPIGIVTALIGAPFFIWVLVKRGAHSV